VALISATGRWRFLANVLLLVALILLWLAYETSKIGRFKVTQISHNISRSNSPTFCGIAEKYQA
jgi:hypothetical protein